MNKKFNLILVAVILLAIGLGCSAEKPEMPSTDAQNALVKQTMSEFTKGVETENFSSLVQSSSKEFQTQLPAEKIKAAFQTMIDKKELALPLLQSTAAMTPVYEGTPAIREERGNYILDLKGSFPTDLAKTNFNCQYVWQDSQWKLLKIEVTM